MQMAQTNSVKPSLMVLSFGIKEGGANRYCDPGWKSTLPIEEPQGSSKVMVYRQSYQAHLQRNILTR